MSDPIVSVVIPAFNRASALSKAIRSVLDQSFQSLEVIVVDDGSTDATADILRQTFALERRVRFLRHRSNRGAQAARNTGIQAAGGEWIAFLDSDDKWLPNSLEIRLAAARSQRMQVVHSAGFIIQAEGEEPEALKLPALSGDAYYHLLRMQGPMFQSLLANAMALRSIGGLDDQIIAYQEWDTVIRLAKFFDFAFVDEPTFVYDCRGSDTISKNLLRSARGYEQVVKKHLFAIALEAGIGALSTHYHQLAYQYRQAGDRRGCLRCKLISYSCRPDPRVPLKKLRELTAVRLGTQ